ncbi:MAG: VIT and VWA domain-containing protein [Phycisphaerales bacterium]
MTKTPDNLNTPDDTGPPPRDDLDAMLRTWHQTNAHRAAAGRDRLVRALAEQAQDEEHVLRFKDHPAAREPQIAGRVAARPSPFVLLRSLAVNPYSRLAASLMILVALVTLLIPTPGNRALAQDGFIMVPEGGRLDALDDAGNLIGPCPLKHTDVNVAISGFFSRVTLKQTYHNPYQAKIEAVYTFPMSHRAAVDRMTMTVGDRVVVGEVKERERARQIYEAARAQGYVASLLEQQRPNIFTQSVANIEPEAQVIVEISYVEVLQSKDGQYTFDFPMVVGPRYIPGASMTSPAIVPAELKARHGVILLGPARLTVGAAGEVTELGSLQTGKLNALLASAQPIKYPGDTWWGEGDPTGGAGQPTVWYRFEAEYGDASKEFGELYTDDTGRINGRWFFTDPAKINEMGTGFSQDTNQVPDASRITPEPVKPGERAGHDISISVTIDTGGPGIVDLKSALHEIKGDNFLDDDEAPSKVTVALADAKEIPNRDFVLSWRTSAETIAEAKLTHAGDNGGFFTLILQPPDRVEVADVPPRELVFVMDISGSMSGYPIEKSKEVMTKAIAAMRPRDTFNVITFAGRTDVLWSDPKPATPDNRKVAQAFINSQSGGGGTEMMKAINAALVQGPIDEPGPLTAAQLVDLPADGRDVEIIVEYPNIHVTGESDVYTVPVRDNLKLRLEMRTDLPTVFQPQGVTVGITGTWSTSNGKRVLIVNRAWLVGMQKAPAKPMRIVLFLTDGYVGNDMAIIGAIKNNAHTTRVFSFGIGSSVNRYLLQGMANAGRGEAEFVLLESDSDAAVERLTKRVETPVLTDITLTFSDGLEVTDVIPPLDAVPDLFDVQPLVIHGRYSQAGKGTLTVAGNTGAGPYERVLDLEFAEDQPEHDVIATLWARAKVEQIMNQDLAAAQANAFPADLKQQVVALGEAFQIMTQYTSFVAVEKSRLTIDGNPVLVAVPIEMPSGVSYEGIFGGLIEDAVGQEIYLAAKLSMTLGRDTLGSAEGDAIDDDERLRSIVNVLSERVPSRGLVDISSGEKGVPLDGYVTTDGRRIDRSRRETGLEGFDIGGVTRTPPPGPLPASATEQELGNWVDQRHRAAGETPKSNQLSRLRPFTNVNGADQADRAYSRLEARYQNAPELDPNSALGQPRKAGRGVAPAPGAGGGGGGSAKFTPGYVGATFGDPGDEKVRMLEEARRSARFYGRATEYELNKARPLLEVVNGRVVRKNNTEGTITFTWQQTRPVNGSGTVDMDRNGSENTRTKFILSGEVPQVSEIPLLGDLFRYKADDDQVLSSSAELAGGDEADKDSVDHRAAVAGKASLFHELKKLVEANKNDDPPADAGAPAPATETAEEVAAIEMKDAEAEAPRLETSDADVALPLLTHLFRRAGRPLLTNEIAILIGQLVEADQIEVANQLTNELVIYLPDYEVGMKMRDAFANTEHDDETRNKAVIELVLKAQAELEAVMFRAWAEARLRNVLEESLYEMLVDASRDDTRPEDRAARQEDALLVSVLATSVDDDVLSALQQAGLIVKAKPTSGSFVVGETSTDRLIDLALLQAVRRIEPARLSPTPN